MKICYKIKNKHSRSAGFSLVEVMLAALILVVLALGGGAILRQSGSTVAIQKNKRVAIEIANRQLERLRTAPSLSVGSFETTAPINGQSRRVLASVVDVGNSARPLKQVTVQVEYRAGGNWVTLVTNMDK